MTGARRQADQALAVPATPAEAVDGPSGFDPSRGLRQPPVVGRYYMVPCVEYTLFKRHDVWPVIGPRHSDGEYIGFDHVHYHIDPRFLTGEQARYIRRNGRRGSVKESVATYVLKKVGEDDPELATLHRRRCRIKEWAYTPPMPPQWLGRLTEAFGEEPIRTADGRILCPHKKADLSQFTPDENGFVTCPLHGLKVRCVAIAIEARSDATGTGAAEGESAAIAQNPSEEPQP